MVLLLSLPLAISYFENLGETYLVHIPPAQKLIEPLVCNQSGADAIAKLPCDCNENEKLARL